MAKLPVLSASQIDTYRSCPRKWAFRKIDGVDAPSHPSAVLGGKVHKCLEDWLQHGIMPDVKTEEGKIAIKSIPELPPPKTFPHDHVEKKLILVSDVGVEFVGFIDLFLRGEDRPDDHEEHWGPDFRDRPCIIDHKTTAALTWAKSAEFLANEDTQLSVYGAWAATETGAKGVDFMWSYTTTKGKHEHRPVRGTTDLTKLDKSFSLVLQDALAIHRHHREAANANEVPANTDACDMYGGCPYAKHCNAFGFVDTKEAKDMGLADKLAKRMEAIPAPAPAAPKVPEVLPPDSPEPTPPAEQVVEAKPKKGRGRPKGSKNKAKDEALEPPAGLMIIVGAVPAKGSGYTDLGEYLKERAEAVAKANKVELYNLVEFGKGPALLAAEIRKNPPAAGAYWVLGGLDRPVLIALKDVANEFLVCQPY